jgi:hypothetical protein
MDVNWTHAAPTVLAAFFASLVEFIEALTIVLAVGAVRAWRGAIGGGLPPATPPIEATATEQKNDDYDDKKRGRVHGFLPRQSVSRGLLAPLGANLNVAGRIFVAAPARTSGARDRLGKLERNGKERRRESECPAAYSGPTVQRDVAQPPRRRQVP